MINLSKQSQDVDDQGVAIQSGRDTIINNGVTPAVMREIMCVFADQLPKFAQIAATLADERIRAFEEKIIDRFSKDNAANSEAFQDPDFQILLKDAQKNYVRSGSDDVSERLADLIVERSKSDTRSRKAMIINRAIEVSPRLTSEEISSLSIIFSIRMVKHGLVRDIESLGGLLSLIFDKFVSHIGDYDSSLTYLESVGCGSISMGSCEIARAITSTYPRQTRTYKKSEDISNIVGNEIVEFANKCGIITIDEKGHLVTTIDDHSTFIESFPIAGGKFAEHLITTLRNEVEGVQMNDIELRNELRPFFPQVDVLFEMWDGSKLSHFELNSTGMAIAHASLSRAINFNAGIDIWIN